ncbi:MAG: GDP-mannose 4,6-dehydratase [Flavobacteriales bacterium]|nr:GDP-mannose 4,6-dehydratase [Flavobacteriales bacterium]MCB9166346.1 GDP-mannose 4,6-dehydratase [Flavobacteriales bacterium]
MARHAVITGGAGFIGSHLVDRLMGEGGWNVTVVDNFDPFYDRAVKEENIRPHLDDRRFRLIEADILDDDLEGRIERTGSGPIDRIVHIAAKAGVRPSIADPVGYHRVNVTGTLKLLELARRQRVAHFVLASSSSVYGEDPNVPWKEREIGLVPISPYAATKIAAEEFARVHARLHALRVTILRFFTVYGPRQRPDLAIHKFYQCIRDGRPIQQYGDGSTRRDYTYIDDIINGVRSAMDREAGGVCEVYNLGNSGTVMLRELIAAIEGTMGRRALIEVMPEQPGDVPQTYADVRKAERDLGFVPGTPLRSGLQRFQDWMSRPVQARG